MTGEYTITYTATDNVGNSSSATRTVNVVDTTAPVVTLVGDNPLVIELGGTFSDPGVTFTDNTTQPSTAPIPFASDAVDTSSVGSTVDNIFSHRSVRKYWNSNKNSECC